MNKPATVIWFQTMNGFTSVHWSGGAQYSPSMVTKKNHRFNTCVVFPFRTTCTLDAYELPRAMSEIDAYKWLLTHEPAKAYHDYAKAQLGLAAVTPTPAPVDAPKPATLIPAPTKEKEKAKA